MAQSGMSIRSMAAYIPPDVWSNARVATRLRLERMRVNTRRRDRGELPLAGEEAKPYETSDRWVKRFIGFTERRFTREGQGTIHLATRASELALELAGILPAEVDSIVFGSVTPSHLYSPPDAALLQHHLGIPVLVDGVPRDIAGVDVSLACTTWVAALRLTYALIRSGMAKNILLVGADQMSAAISWRDRAFSTVLGDAGTATLCSAVPEDEDWFAPNQFWSWLDGSRSDLIATPVGGSLHPMRSFEDLETYAHRLTMDGRAVKEAIVSFVGGPAIDAALAKAGWKMSDLDLATLHEANLVLNKGIIAQWRERGFRGEVLDAGGRFGNTTSASVPLALVVNHDALTVGRRFGLFGFGGGLSAGIVFGTVRHPFSCGMTSE